MYLYFGIESLDKILSNALVGGSILVIAGHPASGKTLLASTICMHNALKDHKCIYISFLEDKLRYFSRMKKLGLDLESVEKRGLMKFYEVPLIINERFISDLIDGVISKAIDEFGPKIVVLDPISPLLRILHLKAELRALLVNSLVNLARYMSGLVILVVEVPTNEEKLELGDIEFIADTVLMLKNIVIKNNLFREIEVRKSKYSQVTISKMLYSIREGEGLKVYVPPLLAEIPSPDIDKILRRPCKSLIEAKVAIHPKEYIYIRTFNLLLIDYILLLSIIPTILNDEKILIISYETSPDSLWSTIKEIIEELSTGINSEALINKIKDYVTIKGYNPASYLPEQLYYTTLELVKEANANTVMFIGETPLGPIISRDSQILETYKDLIVNHILSLKKLGQTIIHVASYETALKEIIETLADITIDVAMPEQKEEHVIRFIRKGKKPIIVGDLVLKDCLDEISKVLRELNINASKQ
ncbi:MAG: ATPase domain-containing protein [Sulfolobales archaeon]